MNPGADGVPADWPSGVVHLVVPAHADFLATVRAMVRSSAALTTLAVDDVEELQMAVSEAAILLLPLVDPDGPRHLSVDLEVSGDSVRISVSATCRPGATPDRDGLAWIMLNALDPDAEVSTTGADVSITLSRSRTAQQS